MSLRRTSWIFIATALLTGCALRTLSFPKGSPQALEKSNAFAVSDASTLTGKLIMGYQGWFSAKGDGTSNGWDHWSTRDRNRVSASSLTVDMWPDVSEYDADELYDTGLKLRNGKPALLFSDHNRKTVMRHFQWMREYGIDGVMNGRFVLGLIPPRSAEANREDILQNIRAAAEANGRVFMVAYDVSSTPADKLNDAIVNDWRHLVDDIGLIDSPSYIRHRGKPVIMVWGLGDGNPEMPVSQAEDLLNRLRNADTRHQVTVMGGVTRGWRAESPADWAAFYRKFDIICPWSVGGFPNIDGVDPYTEGYVKPDIAEAKRVGADYMPVVWPGFSWANLQQRPGDLNGIPRLGGRHWWKQAHRYIEAGSTMLLGAMFDEMDEGTAMLKMVTSADDGPEGTNLLYLDADGEKLPPDWYLRIAGQTGKMLRGEIPLSPDIPIKPEQKPLPGMSTKLGVEQSLEANRDLVSPDRRTILSNQSDGNLVLYRDGVPVWATMTFAKPGRLVMQGDGNLVLYSGLSVPLWASQTNGNPGATLDLQDDGNLVIYGPDGVPIWASHTNR